MEELHFLSALAVPDLLNIFGHRATIFTTFGEREGRTIKAVNSNLSTSVKFGLSQPTPIDNQ
ncbi:MAG: hypothetical protein KA716_22850 [Gloeotrichia echinulata DEX184]|nr:hypothetical protein [Gloeotrichia echinulata DEX184]